MLRFVILEHDHPVLHWDLMLEAGAVLQTWRLAEQPRPGCSIDATPLGDHRLAFLEYEGPISGGRGTVGRWDAGEYAESDDSSTEVRKIVLKGNRINGAVSLELIDRSKYRFTWRSDV